MFKPRRIVIDLDPDQGFPVGLSTEFECYIEEAGERVVDLPPHTEPLAPDSPQALAVLGGAASSAFAALLPYQTEVQRLAGELATAQARLAVFEATTPPPQG